MSKLNTVQNGKGSKPRIADRTAYRNNFDLIKWHRPKDKYNKDEQPSRDSECHRPKH